MKPGLRALIIFGLVVICLFAAPGNLGRGGADSAPCLTLISPPLDIALPVGQGIEVRYRAAVPTILELRVVSSGRPDELLAVDHAERGQEITRFWAPTAEGRHCLLVQALDPRANIPPLPICITISPAGSPVRLEPVVNLGHSE